MPDLEEPSGPAASVTPSRRPRLSWVVVTWVLGLLCVFAWGIGLAYRTPYGLTLIPAAAEAAGLATLEVKVTGAGPLEEVRVEVHSEQALGRYVSVASGRANGEGKISFEELPSGPAWILVRSPKHARFSQRLVLLGKQVVEVALEEARSLVVRVQDEQGAPVGGATLLVRRFESKAPSEAPPLVRDEPTSEEPNDTRPESEELPFGQVTDQHGVARLSGLGQGPFTVSVFAKGYSTVRRDNVTEDLEIVLTQLGALTVSVLGPTGDPVPKAEVQLVGTRVWPAKRAEADTQGRVILGGLPEGLYDLRALAGRLVSPIVANLRLERGERRQVELRLVEGRMIHVKVTTAEEVPEPIAKAKLVLAEHGLSAFPLAAVSDQQGEVELGPLPPGPAFLSVRADGYIARGAVPVPESGGMNVKLLRGGVAYGEIEDVEGRPIRDARIEVVGLDLDGLPIAESPLSAAYRDAHFEFSLKPMAWAPAGELGVTFGPVPFVNMVTENPGASADFSALPSDYSPWVSDSDGHFRAAPIPPGRVRLIVRHNAFAEGQSRIFTMGPGGNVHVKVVLDIGHTLRGRVVDDGDRPVAKARVLVSGVHNGFERGVVSEHDGTFELKGVPSEVNVSLARPEDPTRFVKRQKISLEKGGTDEVEFVLPSERGAVAWTVFDDRNVAVELAQVSVQSIDPDVPLRATQFTDDKGRVSFEDAAGLELRIAVDAPGYVPTHLQVKNASDDVTLVLTRGVKVKGRITAVRGRKEVAGAQVLIDVGGRRDTTTTSGLGEYEFNNVAPGKARIRVSHDEYASVVREVTVEPGAYAERPFEVPDIDLNDAVTIRGKVVDRDGRPVPAARVSGSALSEVRPKGSLEDEVVLTDDNGLFVLSGVAPGESTLYAQSALAGKGKLRVNVPEGGLDGVVLELTSSLKEDGSDFSPSVGSVALGLSGSGGKIAITSVPLGGEAERAGLQVGDEISAVEGVAPKSVGQVRTLLSGPVTSDVVLTVLRGGDRLTYRVRREQTSR